MKCIILILIYMVLSSLVFQIFLLISLIINKKQTTLLINKLIICQDFESTFLIIELFKK